jgi:hypothetical protein
VTVWWVYAVINTLPGAFDAVSHAHGLAVAEHDLFLEASVLVCVVMEERHFECMRGVQMDDNGNF